MVEYASLTGGASVRAFIPAVMATTHTRPAGAKEEAGMAQEVTLGRGGLGKVRSFWIGLLLSVVTLGFYFYFWYWFVNDELKDIGAANDDPNLASSKPASSLLAVTLGHFLVIP